MGLLVHVALGACFGIALVKSEAASWYRIQEMFLLRGGHLPGVLVSGAAVAAVGIRLIRRFHPRAATGRSISVPAKVLGTGVRYGVGGTLFGVGWALTGTCPGPLYVLVGAGVTPALLPLLGALAGAWLYGWLRPRLPH
jgi:uncharacterized membrane protein YedE/YeeE